MMEYVTLELKLETPLITYPDPLWPLRPGEVSARWRWWANALVAGALFELGLLHGAAGEEMIKTPTKEEAECVSKIVGLDLGLGYAGRQEESRASCFRIRFEKTDFVPFFKDISHSIASRYPALRQLLQDDVGVWRDPLFTLRYIDKYSAKLVIDEHIPCNMDGRTREAALGALALAFNLSCFGWGGRRGLGCFSVKAYGMHSSLFSEKDPKELVKRVMSAVRDVVSRAVSKRCSGLRYKEPRRELPPTPVLNITRRYDVENFALTPYMLVTVKKVNWEDLHNFFHRFLSKPRSGGDAFRETLKAWIIGGAPRRPSSMMLAVASDNTAYLSVFASVDWPREAEVIRGYRRPVAEVDMLNATAHAVKEFIDYAKKLGGEIEIWP
jgi:CRISPR-associated protein Cmr1